MQIDFTLVDNLKNIIIESVPKIIGVIVYLIASWLILKIILFICKKALKFSKISYVSAKLNENEFIASFPFEIKITAILLFCIKWILVLMLIIIGADIFGLDRVSAGVAQIIAFLPTLFSAVLIVFVGIFLGSYFRNTLKKMMSSFDMNGSNAISSVVFYIIIVITFIIALNQLGINTDIITNNLTIILGATLAAFTIAFGLGSRDIILRLILGFYSRKNLEIGQKVRIKKDEGIIIQIDNITLTLQTEDKKIVYPIKMIANQKIEIIL